jgi:aprataxin
MSPSLKIGPRCRADDRHIHLHAMSSDRISPAMKTKKHYNSFRTDLGFFVHLSDVEEWIESDARIVRQISLQARR